MRLSEKERAKFFRCRTCGRLVGTLKKELCAGHHLGNAFYVSFWEWILIRLGVNR